MKNKNVPFCIVILLGISSRRNEGLIKSIRGCLLPSHLQSSFLFGSEAFLFLYKFIYLFLAALGHRCCAGFLQLQRVGATLRYGAQASHCGGFSCCGARALGAWASVVAARGLSSCDARAQLLCGMWDLPRPGLEPVSPALAGRFLTTAPPGKPCSRGF